MKYKNRFHWGKKSYSLRLISHNIKDVQNTIELKDKHNARKTSLNQSDILFFIVTFNESIHLSLFF